MLSIGTHNLHDETGTPTPFADVLFFTEAIPRNVRAMLKPHGYRIRVCVWQRDLVIAYKPAVFKADRFGSRYKLAHRGIAKVTPHRGTFWITGKLADGTRAALLDEHRINAAFPPFVRGEAELRPRWWNKHTLITLQTIGTLRTHGRVVFAGGDLNTPTGVSGYQGCLNEGGDRYDRLGSTLPLVNVQSRSRAGSDHRRLRAEVMPRG